MSDNKNKKQAINQAYNNALSKIKDVQSRVENNMAKQKISEEQDKIDAILDKIKKDL